MAVQATCSGTYRVGRTGGSVTLQVTTLDHALVGHPTESNPSSSALRWNHTVYSGNIFNVSFLSNTTIWLTPIPIPHYIQTLDCRSNLQVPSKGIVFSGSISADIVELFADPIGRHVEHVLNSGSCDYMETSWTPKVNLFLIHFRDWIQEFVQKNSLLTDEFTKMSNAPILQNNHIRDDYHPNAHDYLQWNDIPLIQDFITRVNVFLKHHLNDGFLLSWLRYFNFIFNTNDSELDCGFFFRGVNGLIRNFLLQHSISSSVPSLNLIQYLPQSFCNFKFTLSQWGNISFHIYNITCDGLDTIQNVGLYTNVSDSDHVLSTEYKGILLSPQIEFSHFNCQSDINILLEPETLTNGGFIQDITLDKNFTLAFNTSSLSFSTAMDIGMVREKLGSLTIEDFYNNNTNILLKLLLDTIGNVDIQHFDVNLILERMTVKGLSSIDDLEISMDVLMNNLFGMLVDDYRLMVTEIITSFARGPLRRTLNSWIQSHLHTDTSNYDEEKHLNESPSYSLPEFYHFNESVFIKEVSTLLSRQDVISSVNSYSSCVASFLKTVEHDSDLFHPMLLQLKKVFFDNVNVNNLNLIAEDSSHLSFVMKLNENYDSILHFMGTLDYPNKGMSATYNSTISLEALAISLGSNLVYDMGLLGNVSLLSVLMDPSYFLLPLSMSSGLYGPQLHMNGMRFDLQGNLTTPDFVRNIFFESDNATVVGSHAADAINSVVSIFQSVTNGMIHIYLASLSTKEHKRTTSYASNQSSPVDSKLHPIYYVGIIMLFIAFNSYYFATQGDCWNIDHTPSNENISSGQHLSRASGQSLSRGKCQPSSLMFHERIPDDIRVIVPCFIIGSIGVFVVSSFATGASVDLQVSSTQGDEITSIPGITTFSLGKTIHQMYQAQVYLLMFLVLVFSGIWPYVKLILMLISYVLPTSWLSIRRRERLLTMLDAMGKFSLVDSFVLVIMTVSFRFHLDLPDLGIIDSYVAPDFGFYSFLTGTIMSLLIGHGVTFLHRHSSMPQAPPSGNTASRISVKDHTFEVRDFYGYAQSAKLTPLATALWFVAAAGTIVLLVVGSLNRCIVFQFQGIAGELLGARQEAQYSLISLGTSLSDSVRDPTDIGIALIKWTYFFFAIIMPCLGQVIILGLSYLPLTLKNMQRLLYLAEICNAWSAIEVFVLSVLVSTLELHHFSNFMVGNKCDFLHNPLIMEVSNGRTVCFSVQSRVTFGIWYLCIGVLLNSFIFHFGLKLCHTVVKERMNAEAWIVPNPIEVSNEYWNETNLSVIERLMKTRFVGNLLVQPHSPRTI